MTTNERLLVATLILIYTIRKPALRYLFHHSEEIPTPDGWQPRMRTWIKGVEQ